jgi:tripartite-type tricarboxylate transporter receptor subunit TctC
MAGIRMTHVPYKGGPQAMVDLTSGNIQLIFATLATGMPYIRAGRVRTLAVAGAKRFALLPEVPTVAEAGVPGYAIIDISIIRYKPNPFALSLSKGYGASTGSARTV